MLKDLDWLHLTVGFVYEVSRPWPSVLKSNRFLILSIRAIWCFSWMRTVLCALNLTAYAMQGCEESFSPIRLIFGFSYFAQDNAQKIAEFLSSHPRVQKVNYAGLPDHPGRSLHYSQVLFLYLRNTLF